MVCLLVLIELSVTTLRSLSQRYAVNKIENRDGVLFLVLPHDELLLVSQTEVTVQKFVVLCQNDKHDLWPGTFIALVLCAVRGSVPTCE